jgi:hypothetical protein
MDIVERYLFVTTATGIMLLIGASAWLGVLSS